MGDDTSTETWTKGMDINSEEEFKRASISLAETLLRDYSFNEIATIASTHIIYLDYLERSQDSLIKHSDAIEKIAAQQAKQIEGLIARHQAENGADKTLFTIPLVAKISRSILKAHGKKVSSKAASVRHSKNNEAAKKAAQEWIDNKSKYKNRSKFAAERCDSYYVDAQTLYRWTNPKHLKKLSLC